MSLGRPLSLGVTDLPTMDPSPDLAGDARPVVARGPQVAAHASLRDHSGRAAAGIRSGRRLSQASSLHWQADAAWYWRQVTRGCCPAALKVHTEANPHCCLDKIDHYCCSQRRGAIQPLRPVGGMSWIEAASALINRTIVLTGDSITEQQFISLLCLAWYENFSDVDLNVAIPWEGLQSSDGNPFVPWVGSVRRTNTRLIFMRNHFAGLLPVERLVSSVGGVLVRGGWQQALPALEVLREYGRMASPVLLVEALPAHFPGDAYQKSNLYPPAQGYDGSSTDEQMCDLHTSMPWTRANRTRPSGAAFLSEVPHIESTAYINRLLHEEMAQYSNVHVLRISETYDGRGDAHIGNITALDPRLGTRRDCLHWCQLPGVLDAFAMATLEALSSVFSRDYGGAAAPSSDVEVMQSITNQFSRRSALLAPDFKPPSSWRRGHGDNPAPKSWHLPEHNATARPFAHLARERTQLGESQRGLHAATFH